MSYFAKVENGIVTTVIVADQIFVDNIPGTWVETSYDTLGEENNYVGIGYKYNVLLDAFIPPKPFYSWVLNENKDGWEPPVPVPENKDLTELMRWDETNKEWVAFEYV